MEHLWKSCSELHSINVLALRTKILSMHQDTEYIPEYINTLEDAKKRSERADIINTFTEHNLMLVAVWALFATQQFPRAIEKWEDFSVGGRTWAKWKDLYKTAEAREKVQMQATNGKDPFGAAHHAGKGNLVTLAYVPTAPAAAAATFPSSKPHSGKTQGEALADYFNALAAAASTN